MFMFTIQFQEHGGVVAFKAENIRDKLFGGFVCPLQKRIPMPTRQDDQNKKIKLPAFLEREFRLTMRRLWTVAGLEACQF